MANLSAAENKDLFVKTLGDSPFLSANQDLIWQAVTNPTVALLRALNFAILTEMGVLTERLKGQGVTDGDLRERISGEMERLRGMQAVLRELKTEITNEGYVTGNSPAASVITKTHPISTTSGYYDANDTFWFGDLNKRGPEVVP